MLQTGTLFAVKNNYNIWNKDAEGLGETSPTGVSWYGTFQGILK